MLFFGVCLWHKPCKKQMQKKMQNHPLANYGANLGNPFYRYRLVLASMSSTGFAPFHVHHVVAASGPATARDRHAPVVEGGRRHLLTCEKWWDLEELWALIQKYPQHDMVMPVEGICSFWLLSKPHARRVWKVSRFYIYIYIYHDLITGCWESASSGSFRSPIHKLLNGNLKYYPKTTHLTP